MIYPLSVVYSQGGVKFPTGGILVQSREPASASSNVMEVSRSGESPGPTVRVRMEENTPKLHSCSLVTLKISGELPRQFFIHTP